MIAKWAQEDVEKLDKLEMGAGRCGNIGQPGNGRRKMWKHWTTWKWAQEDVETLDNLLNKKISTSVK